MGQFHVTVYVTNPRSAHIATEAMLDRTVIAMSSDIDEDVDTVTGFVQSIEEDAEAVPRRWRITILEADSKHSAPVVSFLRLTQLERFRTLQLRPPPSTASSVPVTNEASVGARKSTARGPRQRP